METQQSMSTTGRGNASPKFRFGLKGKIHSCGYRTLSEFSGACGVDISKISRVVSGWEIPGPRLQRKMAVTLGLTTKELQNLL